MEEKWVEVKGYDVCVDEDGRVLRAIKRDYNGSCVSATPYRYSKPYGCWVNATGVKLATLRAGLSRGTYDIR